MNSQDPHQTAALIIDYFHRTAIHHALWYAEVQHQLGPEKALQILENAYTLSYEVQMKRLGKILGFEMNEGIPQPLLNKTEAELQTLKENVAANWLANDGIWFQAVENQLGMSDAKRCNDSC